MKGQRLYQKAKQIIPGGTQLLSKRPEMFLPRGWPAYYDHARGIRVTDLDGREYIDMSIMGVGANILGYADPDVDRAVTTVVGRGSMCTLNAPEEVYLAERLCELHPWAQMVRYARGGGEAMAVAVRIARASSGRDRIAVCGYHGWSDWYLAANLIHDDALEDHLLPGLPPKGVPRGLAGTALPFQYNHIEGFRDIVSQYGRELAAVVMEPRRGDAPSPGFLEEIRSVCEKIGAVLIFDEITTGFRMTTGGIHLLMGVCPDMAVFAKAMANGYPMAAVIGKADVMDAAQETFISSTNWTERIGPTAALATIAKLGANNVPHHVAEIGKMVQDGWRLASADAGLDISVTGLPGLCHFSFQNDPERILISLFTQMMLERGYLASGQFKPSYAHKPHHVEHYMEHVADVFLILAQAADDDRASQLLNGPPAQAGFYRLTS